MFEKLKIIFLNYNRCKLLTFIQKNRRASKHMSEHVLRSMCVCVCVCLSLSLSLSLSIYIYIYIYFFFFFFKFMGEPIVFQKTKRTLLLYIPAYNEKFPSPTYIKLFRTMKYLKSFALHEGCIDQYILLSPCSSK